MRHHNKPLVPLARPEIEPQAGISRLSLLSASRHAHRLRKKTTPRRAAIRPNAHSANLRLKEQRTLFRNLQRDRIHTPITPNPQQPQQHENDAARNRNRPANRSTFHASILYEAVSS